MSTPIRAAISPPPSFSRTDGFIDGAVQDEQTVHSDGTPAQDLIEGVVVREIRPILTANGSLTEIYRRDWTLGPAIEQVFQRVLGPRVLTAWHVHRRTTDQLFVSAGVMKIVLYDARTASPTYAKLNVFTYGAERPAVVVVPPGVWHGVQNVCDLPATLINSVDRAYAYENPDHWRVPSNSAQIPYSFVA